jgi:hypothetical protein
VSASNRFLKSLALLFALALLASAQGVGDPAKPAKEYVHLNGRVVATRMCPSCPTIKLTDTTHPGTTHYRAGDSFTVTVKGAPNSPVTVGTYTFGNTDGNGNWSITSSWGSGDVGSYTQYWAVGGTPAMPTLIFTVYAN